jgi:hypothetical protein
MRLASLAARPLPRRLAGLVLAACLATTVGCQTPDGKKPAADLPKPPKITAKMPLDEALHAGIDFGGDTLVDVKKLVKKRNQSAAAAKLVFADLEGGIDDYEPHQLLNAGHLVASLPVTLPLPLFDKLVGAERPIARQVGWQLAAIKPTAAVAKAIEVELSRALVDGEEENVLLPQMANAVRVNRLVSAYTMVREGLMRKGNEEFAAAMAFLDPERASDDFLDYLSIATGEELRQLSVQSVNSYACIAILKHLQRYQPRIGNARFGVLFLYAVSRNNALADMAMNVLEGLVPQRTTQLAQLLASHPSWVQIAFLDNARRRMTPKLGLLVAELKQDTTATDVVSEIDEIKL